ncbi:MAG: hypothetical protein JXA44_03790 [Methanospirillaceae archaeon]|nr:hypothetical protein [Methanospirillaceae archaeon]
MMPLPIPDGDAVLLLCTGLIALLLVLLAGFSFLITLLLIILIFCVILLGIRFLERINKIEKNLVQCEQMIPFRNHDLFMQLSNRYEEIQRHMDELTDIIQKRMYR